MTPEKLAELRRLAEACPMPDNDPDTLSEWYEAEDLTERNYPLPPIDAAFIAAASPDVVLGLLDAAELLATVRYQITHGALCPMCSPGAIRWTVGLVCQLCGTDYSRPGGEADRG